METWGTDVNRDDLIRICENIFECKEQKKNLEIQLSEEGLRYDYILKRKELLRHKVLVYILTIALLTWFAILDGFLFAVLCMIANLILLFLTVKMIFQLVFGSDIPFFVHFGEEHNFNTIHKDKEQSLEKTRWLKTQIKDVEAKLIALFIERDELQTKEERDEEKTAFLGIETSVSGRFQLKEADVKADDKVQLFEYYVKEEQYYNNYLRDLETQLHNCEKEVIQIDDDFDAVKRKLIVSTIIFVALIGMQAILRGALYALAGILCFIGSLLYVFYLERVCKRPILRYLIEHNSNLTKEYAFINNMAPEGNKRKQIIEDIEQCKKELDEIKTKKIALEME